MARRRIAFCQERDLPIDFVSTHTYPTDFAYGANGEAVHITWYADATFDDLTLLRELVRTSAYPDAEIHITEWSTSPTFHAFTMPAGLGDRLLLATPDGVVTRDSRTSAVSAVFVNYPEDMARKGVGSASSYPAARALAEVGPARRIRHVIGGLEPGATFLVEIVDWEHGNPAEAWHRLGAPLNLSRAESEHLSRVADALLRFTLTVPDDGVLELDVELAPWAVMSLRQSRPSAGR
ncbi:hypothetical protein [Nonomuraea mesophila]|uniref:hypothetical protein n=1 Tax=Nonomuraea mesophila TaxID=2530382 RepID=UPI001C6FEB62|nr:hypothetical protein [Nonomuraea mesophila]